MFEGVGGATGAVSQPVTCRAPTPSWGPAGREGRPRGGVPSGMTPAEGMAGRRVGGKAASSLARSPHKIWREGSEERAPGLWGEGKHGGTRYPNLPGGERPALINVRRGGGPDSPRGKQAPGQLSATLVPTGRPSLPPRGALRSAGGGPSQRGGVDTWQKAAGRCRPHAPGGHGMGSLPASAPGGGSGPGRTPC